ncbi:unnamed protein product [Parascedosporium putredinis]|uniref:Uncharacterized protein n=1 Tax=Parascedosporium putredinis TaxID=1442378 RepID=A0A9P1H5B1_9PEZI|nr:unnamed protein product [Parascedosporium putredinis]CAI7996200.1 unnamed protein product [Parascedosporium putredinis]
MAPDNIRATVVVAAVEDTTAPGAVVATITTLGEAEAKALLSSNPKPLDHVAPVPGPDNLDSSPISREPLASRLLTGIAYFLYLPVVSPFSFFDSIVIDHH